ncbi:hypothetical protein CEXT_252151 [Caerostris extrusa]|uniref:Uncharacterized protein n=1 Tax=Caerostris extrusa TaxID=172846 RepID=A0AAV4Y3S8_CAEEX|nr:hypothetical protein CEXT_252151 [Caerostris extrusa]
MQTTAPCAMPKAVAVTFHICTVEEKRKYCEQPLQQPSPNCNNYRMVNDDRSDERLFPVANKDGQMVGNFCCQTIVGMSSGVSG